MGLCEKILNALLIFGTGIMFANFQSRRSLPSESDLPKIMLRNLEHHSVYLLRKAFGRLSVPEDFFESRLRRTEKMPSKISGFDPWAEFAQGH